MQNESKASTTKTFQTRSTAEKMTDAGRWLERAIKKKVNILVRHELHSSKYINCWYYCGENSTIIFQFYTLQKAQTEAEFKCIILLVSKSLFIQSPINLGQKVFQKML